MLPLLKVVYRLFGGSKKSQKKKKRVFQFKKKVQKKETHEYLQEKRGLSNSPIGANCFLSFTSSTLLLSFPPIFFLSFPCDQQLRLVFLFWIIIRFCITKISDCSDNTSHPAPPKASRLLHRRLWYNHSSTADCCPGSWPFRKRKNLFSKW